jgi:hypothetical protein
MNLGRRSEHTVEIEKHRVKRQKRCVRHGSVPPVIPGSGSATIGNIGLNRFAGVVRDNEKVGESALRAEGIATVVSLEGGFFTSQ